MAEPKKTTPARKTTKRGPTKAAALKALGLTPEDLAAIKAQQAENQKALEAPSEKPAPAPEEPTTGEFYARNLRNVEVFFRLSRQTEKKRRVALKPRGRRGDLFKLEQEDLGDIELINQVGTLIEIITAAEAKKVIAGQTTNAQQPVNSVLSVLRNELGQPYEEGSVRVEESFENQGVTVATLTPQGGEAGALEPGRRGVDWSAVRQNANQVAAPSNGIISDGFAAPDVAADAVARRNDLEGPAAGGITSVVVGDTERA